MNPTQMTTTLAPIITFIAGLLAGKGVFGLDAATWATIIGGIIGVGGTIWAAIATRNKNIITTTANLPEVDKIKLAPSASSELAQTTPSNVTK
jgi:hypothetical protein